MTNLYSGVWRAGSDPYYLWINATWDSFRAKWQELNAQNLRLVSLQPLVIGNQVQWSGVWRQGSDGHYLWVNANWSNFVAKWQELAAQNLRLTILKRYVVGNQELWAGVWRQGTDGYYLWVNVDWQNFRAKWQELAAQNLRLVDLETYFVGNQQRWAGVWRSGSDGHYLWVNADWQNFRAKWQELAAQNLRLTVVRSYSVGNQQRWAGVWRSGSDPYYLWVNASFDNFVGKWRELASQNLRLINLDTWSVGEVPTVRLHLRILTTPSVPIDTMVTRMRDLYESVGIHVHVASVENLTNAALNDLDVGECRLGQTTAEQNQLFANRNGAGANDVVVYFVRSTVPPLNGCAAHPPGVPSAVVTQGATQWTLAHEVGHVLGLRHINDNNRLMTGNGTSNITNPPPDLVNSEVQTMVASSYTINV